MRGGWRTEDFSRSRLIAVCAVKRLRSRQDTRLTSLRKQTAFISSPLAQYNGPVPLS